MHRPLLLVGGLALAAAAALAAQPTGPAPDPGSISWAKTVLDPKFRAEGVAVADVNKDGKKDVLVGEFWYEAPDWKRHEMQKPGDYGNGLNGYSKVFACWADDVNGDGWPDLVVIDFPGVPCYWLENPRGQGTAAGGAPTHWKRHTIWHSACNETPQYADLLGTGKRVLIMGFQPKGKEGKDNEGQMAYFTPKKDDPTALWDMHPISLPSTPAQLKDGKPVPGTGLEVPGTRRFSHGLGVGDVNGDGRLDVLTSGATTGGVGGWWEQPPMPDGTTPWAFHPLQAPDACADMIVYDVDGDGKNDVITTSAHKFGIWWHKQRPPKSAGGNPSFEKKELFKDLISETHAAICVDVDGDGLKDIVTGKRWWSHGRGEPGSDKAPAVYWLRASKGADGMTTFTPLVIDPDSGIGTQFEVTDVNGDGLPDVVTANKKGVHVIVQRRR